MKKKYTYLGITTIVVSFLVIIGAFMLYLAMSQVTNSQDYLKTMTSLSGGFISLSSKIFIFGIIATIVMSILSAIYYIYEERQVVVLVNAVIGLVETLLFLSLFGSIVQIMTGGLSALLFSKSDVMSSVSSIAGTFQLTCIVVVLGLIYQIIVMLQLFQIIHLSFLVPYMPNQSYLAEQKAKEPVQSTESTENEKGGAE